MDWISGVIVLASCGMMVGQLVEKAPAEELFAHPIRPSPKCAPAISSPATSGRSSRTNKQAGESAGSPLQSRHREPPLPERLLFHRRAAPFTCHPELAEGSFRPPTSLFSRR